MWKLIIILWLKSLKLEARCVIALNKVKEKKESSADLVTVKLNPRREKAESKEREN